MRFFGACMPNNRNKLIENNGLAIELGFVEIPLL
jgi:hypothetical protein